MVNENRIIMDNGFISRGYSEIFRVNFKDELLKLQNLIYSLTKEYIEDHDPTISIEKKLNLNFKQIPSSELWSDIMKKVNGSKELPTLINSDAIKTAFKKIFENPEAFDISAFRARLPSQKRVLYNWHQDEGTWFLSKNKKHIKKFPATLWLSINGASEKDSIQLLKNSHLTKLHDHSYVEGQGFFNAKNISNATEENIFTLNLKPSECVIFHPLTLHRSVPSDNKILRPRYTVDIRYFDEAFKPKFNIDLKLKIKKFIKNIF